MPLERGTRMPIEPAATEMSNLAQPWVGRGGPVDMAMRPEYFAYIHSPQSDDDDMLQCRTC